MWTEIYNKGDAEHLMRITSSFHDSCIKEVKYISGAYVDKNLCMFPVNDKRKLIVIFQCQNENNPVLELEFSGLRQLMLFPVDEQYTCEILESTLLVEDGIIYWVDGGIKSVEDLKYYTGTVICSTKLRWRILQGFLGEEEFFHASF